MNKKLIAAAVSAAIMAPVAAQAEVVVYGRINQAIDFVDTDVPGASSTTDVSNVVSRWGIKASADVGNGMTASARYEFGTTADKELSGGADADGTGNDRFIGDTRIATVGLSGAFGSVTIGNQWSAFYDTVGTHIDPTYTLGYYLYSSVAGGPYRASNTIKYSNSFGPVSLELDVRLNDAGEAGIVAEKINGDGAGLGLSFAASHNITIAVAVDSEDGLAGAPDVDRTGIAIKGEFGGFWGSLGWHQNDTGGVEIEHTQLWLGTSFGEKTSAMIGFGSVESTATTVEPGLINIGVYHSLGGGMKLYYENALFDSDTATGDFDRHLFGMRIDF